MWVEKIFKKEELTIYEKLKKADNINTILHNKKLKQFIKKDLANICLSYLKPLKKYWVSMKDLQKKLINFWFDLGKYWADGKYGVYTFFAIKKFQKLLWINQTWISDINTLKYIYPSVFKTLNLKEGRTIEQTIEFVKEHLWLEKKVNEYKTKLKNTVKSELEKNIKNDILKTKEEILNKFFSLPVEKRFELLVKPVWDGWFLIDFYKNFSHKEWKILEKYVKLEDIIPKWLDYCLVLRPKEIRIRKNWKLKIVHKNYFDIARRTWDKFKSMFSGDEYKRLVILNHSAIKPLNKEFKIFSDIVTEKNFNVQKVREMYLNEQVIRNFYWETIKNYINNYFKPMGSVVDEKFFYSIMKQESKFNPNAISYTWTRWLMQVTLNTALKIVDYNKKLLENPEFVWKYPWIENMLITNLDSFTWGEKFKKCEKWFKWLYTQFYNPLVSIKLSLSYLLYLEKLINKLWIKDKKFKKQLLLVTYNAGTSILKYVKKYNIKNISVLLNILKKRLPYFKYKEVKNYIRRISVN